MAPTQRASYRLFLYSVATVLLLTPLISATALAQSTTLGYGGDGVYPVHCSNHSQRWFRVITDPGDNHYLSRVTGPGGTLYPKPNAPPNQPTTDYLDGVVQAGVGGRAVAHTIGPFTGSSGPHWNWCIGNFGMGSSSGPRFTAIYYPNSGGDAVVHNVTGAAYYTHGDDEDILEWYQSPALGVDPLTVTPNTLQPDSDNGAGDSTYTFRVQYTNGRNNSNNNSPPRWGADNGVPGPRANYVNLDYGPEAPFSTFTPSDAIVSGDYGSDYDWTMGQTADSHLDMTGDYIGSATSKGLPLEGYRAYEARVESEVLLVTDGNMNRPRFMIREDRNDHDFSDGVIYRYTLQPTDYMNFLDNMFQLRYDPPFADDTQDTITTGIEGTPVSNGFVSLWAGGHTYEFWASDDYHPPRGIAHCQVGWPGNQRRVEYLNPEPMVMPGSTIYWLRSFRYTRDTRPFGYPYDCQDMTQYPDVNPVLSGWPTFPQGTVARFTLVGGEVRRAPQVLHRVFNVGTSAYQWFEVVSPFEQDFGPEGGPEGPNVTDQFGNPARPRQATHYTNDDTIRPNFANIFPQNATTPLRGGKWTQSTTYTFLINYSRSPSRSPDFIRCMIRKNDNGTSPGTWRGFTMERADPTDNDYTDGAVFQSRISADQLPGGGGPGDYNYYFVASDGSRSTIFPNRPPRYTNTVGGGSWIDYDPLLPAGNPQADFGVAVSDAGDNDWYAFKVNTPPALANNDVTPASAGEGSDFEYSVTYTDVDGEVLNSNARGDEPFMSSIVIDLFGDPEGESHVQGVVPGSLSYTTTTGIGYATDQLVDAVRPYLVRIEDAANPAAIGLQYQITANDATTITATPVAPALGIGTDPISVGDRIEILQWFRGTMSRRMPSDNVARDGIDYTLNTANLISLGPGLHRYYFEFRDDWGDWAYPDDQNVSVEGELVRFPQTSEFEGPEVLRNTAPILSNYRFTPDAPGTGADGTTATGFQFYVTYRDTENTPPAVIKLGIDGTADTPDIVLDLIQSDPNDTVYSDGAVYETDPVRLTAGSHIFRAQASDGELTFPAKASPSAPLKFSGPEDPANPPNLLDSVPGPDVAQNTPPTLVFDVADAPPAAPSPGLEPDSGTETDSYVYTITYRDVDVFAGVQGNPPEWVRVYIDGVVNDMAPVDPTDRDFTDGAVYRFTKTGLVAGTAHSYYFLAYDGLDRARRPAFTDNPNSYPGPRVDQPPGNPKSLVVSDVPNDQGGATQGNFNPSNDDGGGAQDVTEYRVYYDTTGGMTNPQVAVTVPASGLGAYSFQHDTAPKQTDLWYYVRAFDGTNESTDSNIAGPVNATDNIAPDPPTNLSATDPGSGNQLDLAWTKSGDDPAAGADDVIEYRAYRATQSGQYTNALATLPNGTVVYTDTTTTDAVDYYYVVRAWDGENESGNSNEAGPVQSSDGQPPVLSNFDPAPGAKNVAEDTTIAFDATDSGAGVDAATLDLTVQGVDVVVDGTVYSGSLNQTQVTDGFRFTWTPPNPYQQLEVVKVEIEIEDLAVPNAQKVSRSYRFTITPPPTYAVSGTIMENDGAGAFTPLGGVEVFVGVLSGTSDATGAYTVLGLTNGNFEVRPVKRRFAFDPVARNISIQDADVPGVDFQAVKGYDIKGKIRVAGQNVGMPNVRVSNGFKETMTDWRGKYTIEDSPAGQYVVRPAQAGMVFVGGTSGAAQEIVTLPDTTPNGGPKGEAMDVDFDGAPETFEATGTVSTSTGGRLSGATVSAVLGGTTEAQATTDVSGGYTLTGLGAGTYTVSVAKAGFTFDPTSRDVTVGPSSQNNDFVAYELYTASYGGGLAFLAAPVQPANDDVIAAFGTTQVARWNPNRDRYALASQDPNSSYLDLRPGIGFFVDFPRNTDVQVAGQVTRVNDAFQMFLEAGFNMQGNPYPVDLPWSKLAITRAGPIADYGFTLRPGTRLYDLVSDVVGLGGLPTIPKGAGVWMYSDAQTILAINAPGTSSATADTPRTLAVDANNWIIPIVASARGGGDASTRAGVTTAGEAGTISVPNPPALPGNVDVYLEQANGVPLAVDVRPGTGGKVEWAFVVATDLKQTPVRVTLPDLSQVPGNMRVTLVDKAANERIYARTMTAYEYNSREGGERRFVLEVAPEQGGQLMIRATSAIDAGGSVELSYTLTQSATVTATVQNLAGRPVAVAMPAKNVGAGTNTLVWNLTGNTGVKVPAGQYLMVLEAVGQDGQRNSSLRPVTVNR